MISETNGRGSVQVYSISLGQLLYKACRIRAAVHLFMPHKYALPGQIPQESGLFFYVRYHDPLYPRIIKKHGREKGLKRN